MRHSRAATAATLAVLVPACTFGDASDAGRASVRDSAGITIVETSRPSWSDSAGAWRIDPRPVTEIGLVDGDAPYLLDNVVGATRLEDGRIVVADGRSLELRFFDSAGVFLHAAAGKGGGPGEIEWLRAFGRCGGDSLFVFEINWQTNVYTSDGDFVRKTVLLEPGSPRGPYQLGCSPTGGFVVSGWGDRRGPPQVGFFRSTTPIWILDAEGNEVASLGEHLGSERWGRPTGSGPHPLGRTTRFAFGADDVFLGSGETFEVRRYDRDGDLIGILRAPAEDLAVTDAVLNAYREQQLARTPENRRPALERELRDMPMPAGLPAFTELRLDSEAHLWARRFRFPGETHETWGIFDPAGVFLGHTVMPSGFAVTEIGPDYVLGVATDEDGVQRVRLHSLERRGG